MMKKKENQNKSWWLEIYGFNARAERVYRTYMDMMIYGNLKRDASTAFTKALDDLDDYILKYAIVDVFNAETMQKRLPIDEVDRFVCYSTFLERLPYLLKPEINLLTLVMPLYWIGLFKMKQTAKNIAYNVAMSHTTAAAINMLDARVSEEAIIKYIDFDVMLGDLLGTTDLEVITRKLCEEKYHKTAHKREIERIMLDNSKSVIKLGNVLYKLRDTLDVTDPEYIKLNNLSVLLQLPAHISAAEKFLATSPLNKK